MFLWWSDPYTGLTVALVVLTVVLALKVFWRGSRFGRSGAVIFAAWLLVVIPWAFITRRITASLGVEIFQPAADAALSLSDGRMTRLRDERGHVVVLDFWATWCAPCRASEPALADLSNRFGHEGLVILGVSADDHEGTWRKYIKEHPEPRAEMRDGRGEIAGQFGVDGRPTFVLIDRQGRVRWKQTGWTPYSYLLLRYRIGKLLDEGT